MKKDPQAIIQRLSEAQKHILEGAQPLLNEQADVRALAQHASKLYHGSIKSLFTYQENVLFPRLYGLDPALDQTLFMAKDDHAEIELLFQRLETEVNQLSILREIPIALQQHFNLEESEVFPTIEKRSDDIAWETIGLPPEGKAL